MKVAISGLLLVAVVAGVANAQVNGRLRIDSINILANDVTLDCTSVLTGIIVFSVP